MSCFLRVLYLSNFRVLCSLMPHRMVCSPMWISSCFFIWLRCGTQYFRRFTAFSTGTVSITRSPINACISPPDWSGWILPVPSCLKCRICGCMWACWKPCELAPKSWILIKAYSGALCKLGSVCDRTRLFQFQTATLPVVVIHITIYLFHQFVHRQFSCVIETLRLQHRKEAFHRCIVPTIRLTRHTLNHGMLGKQFPISRRTVQHTSH